MFVTTWDGHVRVDRAPDGASMTVTLLTARATVEAELRRGLAAEFVVDDPVGPPAWVRVELENGELPADVVELLGPRVAAAAADPASSEGTWMRLDLVEVDDLASAWAPYRARVLAPADRPAELAAGRWSAGWWTQVELPSLREVLGTSGPPTPVFRGEGDPPSQGPGGTWELPGPLADAAGCARVMRWTPVSEVDASRVRVVLSAERLPDPPGAPPPATLLVAPDRADGRWLPMRPSGEELRLELDLSADEAVALRFRTEAGA